MKTNPNNFPQENYESFKVTLFYGYQEEDFKTYYDAMYQKYIYNPRKNVRPNFFHRKLWGGKTLLSPGHETSGPKEIQVGNGSVVQLSK